MPNTNIEKLIPNFKGKVEPEVEREIILAIQRIYEIFEIKYKELEDKLSSNIQSSEARTSSLVNGIATKLIGDKSETDKLATLEETNDLTIDDIPSLPTSKITTGKFGKNRLPTDNIYSDLTLTVAGGLLITGTVKLELEDGTFVNVAYV